MNKKVFAGLLLAAIVGFIGVKAYIKESRAIVDQRRADITRLEKVRKLNVQQKNTLKGLYDSEIAAKKDFAGRARMTAEGSKKIRAELQALKNKRAKLG